MQAETQGIVLFGSTDRMRRQTADVAVMQLIQESCFLSPERARHAACRAKALEILGLYDATDEAILAAISAHARFAMNFYCQGAATRCSGCGGLVGPGHLGCPECGQVLEQPVGVLARPEWETRLTTKALEVAITTALVVDDLLMVTIHRTVRLLVLRNLLSQSGQSHWKLRASEIRQTVLDAWPEGRKPDKESWEYRFIRACAVFWVVGWPMLKAAFTLPEVDERFNTRLVRAVSISAARWADAGADPDDYGHLVRGIMETDGLNKEKAILALSPADIVRADPADPADPETQPAALAVVLHPPELFMRGTIAYTPLGVPWLAIPLEQAEVEALETRYGIAEAPAAELIARFAEETEP